MRRVGVRFLERGASKSSLSNEAVWCGAPASIRLFLQAYQISDGNPCWSRSANAWDRRQNCELEESTMRVGSDVPKIGDCMHIRKSKFERLETCDHHQINVVCSTDLAIAFKTRNTQVPKLGDCMQFVLELVMNPCECRRNSVGTLNNLWLSPHERCVQHGLCM